MLGLVNWWIGVYLDWWQVDIVVALGTWYLVLDAWIGGIGGYLDWLIGSIGSRWILWWFLVLGS